MWSVQKLSGNSSNFGKWSTIFFEFPTKKDAQAWIDEKIAKTCEANRPLYRVKKT